MAQQAGEKALKALYEASGLRIPRTHDLDVLLHGLEDQRGMDTATVQEAALVLTAYGVDARYPGFEADREEAFEAPGYAEAVLRWVTSHIPR